MFERLKDTLEQRPAGATTVDALREFVSSFDDSDEQTRLRKRIIGANEALRLSERARSAAMEELVAESIARDLGDVGPDDIRPRLIAASVTAAFSAVRDRLQHEVRRADPPRGGARDPRPGDRVPARRARGAPARPVDGCLRLGAERADAGARGHVIRSERLM